MRFFLRPKKVAQEPPKKVRGRPFVKGDARINREGKKKPTSTEIILGDQVPCWCTPLSKGDFTLRISPSAALVDAEEDDHRPHSVACRYYQPPATTDRPHDTSETVRRGGSTVAASTAGSVSEDAAVGAASEQPERVPEVTSPQTVSGAAKAGVV